MKKIITVLMTTFFMLVGTTATMAETAALPDNAKVVIMEYGKKNVTSIGITGVEATRIDVYSHLRVAPTERVTDDTRSFTLDPGQGFNFQFKTHDGSVKWVALTGNEHIFGQPHWLGEGLVILPVSFGGGQKGAEIFVKKYLNAELQKAIDAGQPIAPLFIN